MDDAIKFILEQLNENISMLREETHQRLANIEKQINEKVVTVAYCKSKRNESFYQSGIKKDEISLKKISIICGTVSLGISSIISVLAGIINNN